MKSENNSNCSCSVTVIKGTSALHARFHKVDSNSAGVPAACLFPKLHCNNLKFFEYFKLGKNSSSIDSVLGLVERANWNLPQTRLDNSCRTRHLDSGVDDHEVTSDVGEGGLA